MRPEENMPTIEHVASQAPPQPSLGLIRGKRDWEQRLTDRKRLLVDPSREHRGHLKIEIGGDAINQETRAAPQQQPA
jgi:hypothetical protein